MEENNKVIIFEKKEIIIVLIFVVVLIITSFTLGIRLGKKLAFNEAGIKSEDVKTVEDVKVKQFTPEEEKIAANKLADLQKNDPQLDILGTIELYMKDNKYDVSQEGLKKLAEKLGIPNFT